jgi:hypothetical protein
VQKVSIYIICFSLKYILIHAYSVVILMCFIGYIVCFFVIIIVVIILWCYSTFLIVSVSSNNFLSILDDRLLGNLDLSLSAGGDVKHISTKNNLSDVIEV